MSKVGSISGKARRRLLFVAENITLAQVVRLVTLAEHLDRTRFDVHFAASEFDPLIFEAGKFSTWPLFSIDRRTAFSKLERGQRLYEASTLRRYVDAELRLIDAIQPDLVIGDFRLSLPISAAVAGVPCGTLINGYWSPYAVREVCPRPDHPRVKFLGERWAARYCPLALPAAFRRFASPVNEVRKAFGLRPVPDLLHALTDGDFTLYPDLPELCPTIDLPAHHHYLGHVPWSPRVTLPVGFWSELAGSRPLVYVTLGSSGQTGVLPALLEAAESLPITLLLATAGRLAPRQLPSNVRAVDFVPGDVAARFARFVITNGGSTSGYQALAAGRPVLGLASNMDQYLAMTAIENAGAGLLLRAGDVTPAHLRSAMCALLESSLLHDCASALGRRFAAVDCHARFEHALEAALNKGYDYAKYC